MDSLMSHSIEILDFESQENLDLGRATSIYTLAMKVGQWVKACRAAAAITQTTLGDALGVTKGNVSAWENDKHEPSYSQMVEIVRLARFEVPFPGVPATAWPFREIRPEQYARLSPEDRVKVEERALMLIEGTAAKSPRPTEAA